MEHQSVVMATACTARQYIEISSQYHAMALSQCHSTILRNKLLDGVQSCPSPPPQAHCHMTVVSYFVEALSQYSFTPENEAIMKSLSDLYALHGIVENAAGFMNVRSVCLHVCVCGVCVCLCVCVCGCVWVCM